MQNNFNKAAKTEASTRYISASRIFEMFGNESYGANTTLNGAANKGVAKNLNPAGYANKSWSGLNHLIQKIAPSVPDWTGWNHEELTGKYYGGLSQAFEKCANTIMDNAANWRLLPDEVRPALDKLKASYNLYSSKLAAVESAGASSGFDYGALKWKRDYVKNAISNMVFGVLSRGYEENIQRQANGMTDYGTEGVNPYPITIFYPVMETTVQFMNAVGTFYNKVLKNKQLLNEATSIPVHSMIVYVDYIDPDTNIVLESVLREDHYQRFDVSDIAPTSYKTYDFDVKFDKSEFGQMRGTTTDVILSTGAPLLTGLQEIRPDFRIMNVEIGTTINTGEVYADRNGRMKVSAVNEMDRHGRVLYVFPDLAANPQFYYGITIRYDGARRQYYFAVAKSDAVSMTDDIESITFRFHLHDVNNQIKPNVLFRPFEEVGYINAGALIKHHIPINTNEFTIVDARTQGDMMSKQVNLVTEYINQTKENIFFTEFNGNILPGLRQKWLNSRGTGRNTFDLYASQHVDIAQQMTTNKGENLALTLGQAFQSLQTSLEYASNTPGLPKINFYCHTMTRNAYNPALKPIIGTINEESNGSFLEVPQTEKIFGLSYGADAASPAIAVIVTSGKDELKPIGFQTNGTPINPALIEYRLNGIPYFPEANTETILGTETAVRITNSADWRSGLNVNLPHMLMETTFGVARFRDSGADMKLTGHQTIFTM